jgi:hypothetical protein
MANIGNRYVQSPSQDLDASQAFTFAESELGRKAAEMQKFQRLQVMQLHHFHVRQQELLQQHMRAAALQQQQQNIKEQREGQEQKQQQEQVVQTAQGLASAPPYTFLQVSAPPPYPFTAPHPAYLFLMIVAA